MLTSDDLHRQVWVLMYARRAAEAVERLREQLGNWFLVSMSRGWKAMLAPHGDHEARELFWEAAQESHSYLQRNHAAAELGIEQIRSGAPVQGLLLLRAQPVTGC